MKEKRKFSDWFENVFWYHYRWRAVAVVFVVAFAVFAVIQYVGSARPDFTVVYARSGENAPAASELRKKAVSAYKEYSGDSGAKVSFLELSAGVGGAEKAEAKLYAFLYDPDIALYILDDYYFSLYDSLGFFEEGTALGGGLYGAVRDMPADPVTNETQYYEKFEQHELDEINAEIEAEHQGYLAAARAVAAALKGAA